MREYIHWRKYMSFKVAAWNSKGVLASPKADKAIEVIKQIDADVFIFPEAYNSREYNSLFIEESLTATLHKLGTFGYQAVCSDYDDPDYGYPVRRGLVYASRLGDEGQFTHLGEQKQVHSFITDPDTETEIEFWGVHFDESSDKKRLQAIDDLPGCHSRGVVMAGSFNTMPSHSRTERLVGSNAVRIMMQNLPHGRLTDTFGKLNDMVRGSTVEALGFKGLHDISHQPTWPSSLPFAQLDRIMTSDNIKAGKFEIGSSDQAKLSDHLSVSAIILT